MILVDRDQHLAEALSIVFSDALSGDHGESDHSQNTIRDSSIGEIFHIPQWIYLWDQVHVVSVPKLNRLQRGWGVIFLVAGSSSSTRNSHSSQKACELLLGNKLRCWPNQTKSWSRIFHVFVGDCSAWVLLVLDWCAADATVTKRKLLK